MPTPTVENLTPPRTSGSIDIESIGEGIRRERLRRGLTLAQLASQVNLTVSALSQIDSRVGRWPIVVRHDADGRLGTGVAEERHDTAGLVEERQDRPVRQQRRIELAGRVVPFRAAEQQNRARVRQHGQRVEIIEPSRRLRHRVGDAAARGRTAARDTRSTTTDCWSRKSADAAAPRRIVAARARQRA